MKLIKIESSSQRLKREVNLTQFAAAHGFVLDHAATTRSSVVMIGANGEKIIVAKNQDGQWVYCSMTDPSDSGSIFDFVRNHEGGGFDDAEEKLRTWIDVEDSGEGTAHDAYVEDLEPVEPSQIKVQAEYAAMRELQGHHDYLERDRCIPPHFLTDPRFAERIRIDSHGNAVFPHFNDDGLCGYEIKNAGFSGFARGGARGLWSSVPGSYGQADRVLVIAETAIDALSYAALHKTPATRYVSTAGPISPGQQGLLIDLMQSLPEDGRIVLAPDYDAAGIAMAKQIEDLLLLSRRGNRELTLDHPPTFGHDWNDVLQLSADRSERPASRLNPCLNEHPTHKIWL